MKPKFITECDSLRPANLYLEGVEFLNLATEEWSDLQKSRFIESLILNVPIPPIVFFRNPSGTKTVIDGRKRIQAIVEFRKDELELTDLEFCPQLNGLTDWDLSHNLDGYVRQANAAFTLRRIKTVTVHLDDEKSFTPEEIFKIKTMLRARFN